MFANTLIIAIAEIQRAAVVAPDSAGVLCMVMPYFC